MSYASRRMGGPASSTHALRTTGAALAKAIRQDIIEQSMRSGVGHIGSALSIADMIAAVFGGALNVHRPDDPERDRLVLSKGHAVLALYSALHRVGLLSPEQLSTFASDGTALAGHPEHGIDGIDFSTGSLGHGLSMGVGAALAARLQGSPRRAIVVLSDAECNEGSVWEAIMFAAHHRLGNVVAIVDVNGQQALGRTRDVMDLSPLAERWAAFGWEALEVDGHDVGLLEQAIAETNGATGLPRVLLARTTFGKGVSFMEGRLEWHYLPMSPEQYDEARRELGMAS